MSMLRPLARSLLCQHHSSLLNRFAALQICGLKTLAPKKPKAPLTPYFLFKEKNYQKVKAGNPGAPVTELSKTLGAMYKELPVKEKEVLLKQYREEKVKYQAQLEKFMDGLSEEDKIEMEEDRKALRQERRLRKKSKLQREYGMPKKPASAFGLFLQSKLPERENVPVTEYMKSVAAVWRGMPEEDKQKFRDQATKEREMYQEEMKSWTRRMKKSGHTDLVENKTQKAELRTEIKKVKRRYLKRENVLKKELLALKKERMKEVGELQKRLDLLK